MSQPQEITNEIMVGVPPVTVLSMKVMGISLSEWVLITTLIYTVLAILFLLYRWGKLLVGRTRVNASTGDTEDTPKSGLR